MDIESLKGINNISGYEASDAIPLCISTTARECVWDIIVGSG